MSDKNTTGGLSALSAEIGQIARVAEASIVRVHARRGPTGSGFVWRPGLIVSAEEAVEVDDGIHITLANGTRAAATLVGRDPSTDVALLRCDAATAQLSGGIGTASIGQLAIALGCGRRGQRVSLAMIASVAGPWQSLQGGHLDQFVDLDMRFDRGMEGAALLSPEGALIGMVAAGPRHTSIAIPAATIERVAAQLLARGRIARGYVGLGLQPVHIAPAPGAAAGHSGVMVMSLDANGPGMAAGMLQGDIVLSWNGEAVGGMRDVMRRLGSEAVGQTVDLALQRAGQPASVRLTIGERPTT